MSDQTIDYEELAAALRDEYELLDQLGRGAFGTVFKAVQRSTGQPVAVKVQSASRDDERDDISLRRFEREVRLCAALNHPNIVRILDQGRRGRHVFIVFEFVPGETLTELLARQGALPANEALPLMAQVLEAIDEAHRQGIVHRDLKPDNIMVSATGTQRHIKVLDFGIGAFTASMGPGASLTLSRELLGTPSYCAPEQLRGEPATVRSDLYSWGLVLLECLTGRRVMDGATVAQVLYRQLSAREIPLPTPLATHPLGDILRRVLAKAPSERVGDAGKLWNDLRHLHTADLVIDLGGGAGGPGATAATAVLDVPRASGEKRQATLFCCSLSAAPASGAEVDDETLDAVQRDQLSLCVDVVTRFGGHVAGTLGDRLLVAFGLPEASDSDARRAAYAALELAARVRSRRPALASQRGIDLDLRIGIHTGIVLVDVDGTPSGPALNVAARLESLAPAGAALVSETTRDLLARHLRFQRLDGVVVGPPAKLLGSYLLMAERAGAGAPAANASTLIGRDAERTELVGLWEAARNGAGQVALIRGEPGIGKSRLVQELRSHAVKDGGDDIDCQCLPEDNYTALSPVLGAIRQQFDLDRDSPGPGLARLGSALGARGLDVAESMAILGPWLAVTQAGAVLATQLSPERQRERLMAVLARLLCPSPSEEPRLVVVEDLHWSDPTTRELVEQLAALVPGQRVLLLLTTRFDLQRHPPGAHVLELRGLNREAVERLVAAQTHAAAVSPELVAQVVERTDGVPLFVEELTRSLLETPRQGQPSERLGDVAVPASLRDLLNGRLARLGTAKETVQLASAIGREFEMDLLSLVSSRAVEALQVDLDRLVEAQLLHRHWEATSTRYVFRHALIREAAWESMLSPQRRAVHRAIAESIETAFPEQARREPAHLARHYEFAGLPEKGIEYRLKAAQRAILGSAYPEASEHLQAGIALLELLDRPEVRHDRELELRNTMGGVLLATQGFATEAVLATYARSRALLEVAGADPLQRLTTLRGLWSFHNARANYATAQDIVGQLTDLAEANDRPEFQLAAHQCAAETAFLTGRFKEAVAHSKMNDRWFNPEQLGDQVIRHGTDPWLSALSSECMASALLGRISDARRRLAQGFSVCERLGSASQEAGLLAQGAAVEMFLGTAASCPNSALEVSLAYANKAIAMGQQFGLRFVEGYARLLVAMIGAATGVEQGIADLQRSIEVWRFMGLGAAVSWHLAFLARGQMLRRDYDGALASARAALQHCQAVGEGYGESESYRVLAVLLGDPENPQGDPRKAVDYGYRSLEIARQQEAHWLELQAARVLATRLKGQAGPEAMHHLAEAAAWFDREGEGADLPLIQETRALLA